MRILNDAILRDKYQVIIIGAGIGGLTVAALLAKRGVDALVIEQHYLPGGCCTSFKREDRVFDCGAATLYGFGEKGFNSLRYVINELEEEIEIIPRDIFFRMWFLDNVILFWKDVNEYLKELIKVFPDQEEEIQKFYKYLYNFYEKFIKDKSMLNPPSEMTTSDKLKLLFRYPIGTINLGLLLSKSALDIMKPYIKNEKLIAYFDMLFSGFSYTLADETPATMALTMLTDNHEGGPVYVAGGAQVYSSKLEKAIEKYGGSLLYRHYVQEILMDKNHAVYGVKLDDGTEILAEKVVSDASVWNLYEKLIARNHISEKQLEWARNFKPTYPAIVIYAAVDKKIFPDTLYPVEFFITDSNQVDAGDIMLYIPSLEDRTLCPPDEHVITIFSPAPGQTWPSPENPEYQSTEYKERKKLKAEEIFGEIEKRFPGFKEAIKMSYIGTPSTIEKYTLKNGGCVGGPLQSIGQEVLKRLHARTDWKNLYACGDSTTMGMSVPAVTVSGIGAANVILKDFGLNKFSKHSHEKQYPKKIPFKESTSAIKNKEISSENAIFLARECQHCENPPCSVCPAGIDIPNFIRRIEVGNYEGAAKSIQQMNPFIEICGILCPAEKYCQNQCYRKNFSDNPVRIKDLHRWVAQYLPDGQKPIKKGKKIAVVGGDIDGLTVSYYLARIGYSISLFEKQDKLCKNLYDKSELSEEIIKHELRRVLIDGVSIITNKEILREDIQILQNDFDAVYIACRGFDFEILEGIKIKDHPNMFSGRDLLSDIKKEEISPIIGISRECARFIDEYLVNKE
ncbi:MAG: NAD(P)-binding protein [Candidatus Lokiarchaeota archaeon]|nr:NAD(P)-binding protein [Candidatus Lokiarchaeota archaeon]